MTDDERRDWLASLRPGDRAAYRPYGQERYRQGCTLASRWPPFDWRPDVWSWEVVPDKMEGDDEDIALLLLTDAELEPPPYPGMTGVLFVGPPLTEPTRRRTRRVTPTGTASSARTPGGPAPRRTSGGRRSPGPR